ncbi:retrovirus-related pol polyprotein from transposon TNT 1-94 [Tanacetum coccineum]
MPSKLNMSASQDEIPPPPPPPPSSPQTPTQQTPHTVSTIKLPILKKGEYDIWAMKMEHYLAHTDYPIWSFTKCFPQLDHEDLEQIDEYDLEEMDLQWQVAMISMRMKRFYKKTGRKLQFDAKEPVGFDKTKVKCYNCYKTRHFARKCRIKGNQDNRRRDAWNSRPGWEQNWKKRTLNILRLRHRGLKKFEAQVSLLMQQGQICTKTPELVSEPVVNESNVACQPKVWSDAPIIKEYESDSEDEYVSIPTKEQETPSFANQQVKTPRETVKNHFTHSKNPKVDKKELGYGFTARACFVCGSLNHLIRDCDFHEKRMAKQAELNNRLKRYSSQREKRPIWNNVQRVNQQNQFVPTAVLIRTGKIPVNTARASGTKNVSTTRHSLNRQAVLTSAAMKVNTVKPIVNIVKPITVFHKTHSPFSRPFNKTTTLRTNFLNQKVNTAKVNAISAVGGKGKLLLSPQQVVIGDHKDTTGTMIIHIEPPRHITNSFKNTLMFDRKPKTQYPNQPFFIRRNFHIRNIPPAGDQMKDISSNWASEEDVPSTALIQRVLEETSDNVNSSINFLIEATVKSPKLLTNGIGGNFIEFCGSKGIKRKYSNAITLQQNGVAKRKNKTLIEAARTMLADSFLPNTFWAEAVSTACYVLNRLLVTKPHNKTPYELVIGKIPIISYIRPFGCHVTILNTIEHLGKFDGKSDEGFLVRYSLQSKAFRVYNLETKRVEENLHITFLENKPNVAGKGPTWLFDLDYLTGSMNYQSWISKKEDESAQVYIVLPIWSSYSSTVKRSIEKDAGDAPNKHPDLKKNGKPVDKEDQVFLDELERLKRQEKDVNDAAEALRKEFAQQTEDLHNQQFKQDVKRISEALEDEVGLMLARRILLFIRNMKDEIGVVVKNKARVYVSQPPGFIDPKYPQKVYKVVKVLYGLHQAPRAWYATLSTFLLKNGYRRGTIDKTLFMILDEFLWENSLSFLDTSQTETIGIFIVRVKLLQINLKKFDFVNVKTASTPIETQKPLVKDEEASDVDVTPKTSHLSAVKRIFRRLISWQCKKQTIVATSTTEAEYVAAANCCGQVLWIQNQMLDYGFNFMNTKIYIDNESTICIVKNPV